MYLLSCSNVLVALLIHLWLDMAGEIFYGVDNATVHCEHLDMVLYFTLHEISSMRPKDDGHKHDMELIQIVFITHTLILFFQLGQKITSWRLHPHILLHIVCQLSC